MSASWPAPGAASVGRADNRPVVLRAKYPDEALDYSVPIAALVEPSEDVMVTLAVTCAPSGDGELTLADLVVDEAAIWVKLSGGQPGRIYSVRYVATLETGAAREIVANLTVTRVLPTDQPQVAPDTGFGPPLTWETP